MRYRASARSRYSPIPFDLPVGDRVGKEPRFVLEECDEFSRIGLPSQSQ